MLTEEELQKILDQFDEEEMKLQGTFGILQFGGGPDESFIRANKAGLELFALQLLKSARDAEAVLSGTPKKIIPFDYHIDWIDEESNTFIQYVELIDGEKKTKPQLEHKPTVIEKLIPYGCGLVILILLIAVIVGMVTLFKWLF